MNKYRVFSCYGAFDIEAKLNNYAVVMELSPHEQSRWLPNKPEKETKEDAIS